MLDSETIDVHTEIFEGPLDLLLYLIKKDNLDIYDIPIAQITHEYLAYLDIIKELNLDTAGEFLLMAATLMQIKVKMLLPSQAEVDQDQGPDPRVELAAKLSEYEKYKAAALVLDSKYDQYKDIFYRGSPKFAESDKVLNLELFDLLEAVKRAFETIEEDGSTLSGELFPIETRMEKIITLLTEREWILLDDVFKGEKKRMGVITCFMALLELIKQRKIFARQDNQFGEIRVYLSQPEAAPQAAPVPEPEPAPQPVQLSEPAEAEEIPLPAVPEAVLAEEELSQIEEQLAGGATADALAHLTPPPALEPETALPQAAPEQQITEAGGEQPLAPPTERAPEFPPSAELPQNEISPATEQAAQAPAATQPAAPAAEAQPDSAPAQPEENPEQPAPENGEEKQPPQGA